MKAAGCKYDMFVLWKLKEMSYIKKREKMSGHKCIVPNGVYGACQGLSMPILSCYFSSVMKKNVLHLFSQLIVLKDGASIS
jgi:hypothetical protein